MEMIREYAITLGWIVCFLLLAIVARYLFDWISPFSLREASAKKNAAIGRVLRGLYSGLPSCSSPPCTRPIAS
jgi:hypothetical protein